MLENWGGLSDVTEGKDLGMDRLVPANHLLIVPRDDGRGGFSCYGVYIFDEGGKYEVK